MNYMMLSAEYARLFDELEASSGVLTPEIEAYMDSIGARTIGALFSLQDLREEAAMAITAIKDKISAWSDKIDRLTKTGERLKDIQINLMDAAGQKTMTNGVYKITRTINPVKVVIEDDTLVPVRYLIGEVKLPLAEVQALKQYFPDIVEKISIDKKQISDLYKTGGVEVPGCVYVRDANVKVS